MPLLGYTRVSRVGDRAERLISPELQQERITAYAKAHKLGKVEMLEPELDVSGGRVERPVLDAAIERVERGEAKGIIVAQLDRLSRLSLADVHKVIERIEAAGGEVIAVAENFDASTPEGEWTRDVFLGMGRMQLRRYSAQFAAAKAKAVREGIWPTNTPPRGYRLKHRKHGGDGRLRVDKREAAKVVKAFEARAAGASWREVAEILGRGYSGARKTIRNRAYLGEIRLRVNGEVVVNDDNPHDAIVPRDLWEAAQIAHPRPPRGIHGPALLTGLVRCFSCQRTMTPNLAKGQRAYSCRGHGAGHRCEGPAWISQRVIEPYVEAAVVRELRARVKVGPRTDEVEQAERELAAAEAELDAYSEGMKVAEIGAEHFAAGMKSRVAAVEAAREELGRTRTGPTPQSADALDAWEELSVEDRRAVLARVYGVIWVRRGRGLPVEERVRLVPLGDEPSNLSRPGRRSGAPTPISWDDLPVEVGTTSA
jgi:DNA invertase Pin-like site-specific DNA recombinase